MGCFEDDFWVDAYFIAYARPRMIAVSAWTRRGLQPPDATHVFQCLTTASVESIMVPSMSKRKPSKVACSGGAE